MVTINDARITFVFGECFTSQLADRNPPFPAPWEKWDYVEVYDQIRGGNVYNYGLPWRESQKSAFWRHYLGDSPGSVSSLDAWGKFVPLRLVFDTRDIATDSGERVQIDAFGFRFGVVVALTVHVAKSASMPMESWIDRLRTLRNDAVFREGTEVRTLGDVLATMLDRARASYYHGSAAGTRSAEPFSINIVLQAEGGSPAIPISQDLQRQLHAVTAWPANWQDALLPAAGPPAFLPIRGTNQVAGDVHYAASRGRTVWRPGLFARHTPQDGPQRRHTLSCLAHNLVAGAVLSEFLRLFAIRLAAAPAIRKQIDVATVRELGAVVDRLHRGVNTFRSSSIQQQLEDSSSKEAVNALLSEAGAPRIP